MKAEVLKSGQIKIESENDNERMIIQSFVEQVARDAKEFTACCHNKRCEFKIKINDNRQIKNNP